MNNVNSAKTVAMVRSIIEDQKKQHDNKIAEMESNTKLLSDSELLAIFAEYFGFAMNEGFLLEQRSPRYKAYFDVVNAATLEMLNNPQLYQKATKREHSDLVAMCNNRYHCSYELLQGGKCSFVTSKTAIHTRKHTIGQDFAHYLRNNVIMMLH